MGQVEVLEPARVMRSGGYKVNVSRGERNGRVSSEWFNRPDDERNLSLDDLRGHTLVTPDPDSITAMMVRAMMRTSKLPTTTAKPNLDNAGEFAATIRIITTRYQDAVPFYIENGFADVGATAAKSVVKSWTDKGGKVLVQSRAVPIKQLLVSKSMPVEEQDRIRTALLGIGQSKPGRDALEAIGYKGFVATNPEVEASTIAWLGL